MIAYFDFLIFCKSPKNRILRCRLIGKATLGEESENGSWSGNLGGLHNTEYSPFKVDEHPYPSVQPLPVAVHAPGDQYNQNQQSGKCIFGFRKFIYQ